MLGVVHRRLDGRDEPGNGDGDGGGQVGVFCLSILGDGNALHFLQGLALHIVRKSLSLLIPLLADGAVLTHAVGLPQLVLGLDGGVDVAYDGAGGVEVHLGLHAVNDALKDNAVFVHGDSHHGHVRLGKTGFFPGILAGRQGGGKAQAGFYGVVTQRLGFRGLGGFLRLGHAHHCGGTAACKAGHRQQQCQGQSNDFFHVGSSNIYKCIYGNSE